MRIKIWQRYIFLEFLKFFAFFLLSFYFLYVLIDYSTHMQDFLQGKNSLSILKLIQYYIFQFVKRADILLPLALLISSIKVLCQLNSHQELLAFQSAGLEKKRLLRPLLFFAAFCSFLNLGLNEFAVPHSLNVLDKFYDAHLRHSFRGKRTEPLHVLHLNDHSKLVYQYYDSANDAFFDVIWIRSSEDIWRMKYLKIDSKQPQGEFVDHLIREKNGCFEKGESYSYHVFKDLQWEKDLPRKGYIPFENRSIGGLRNLLKEKSFLSEYERQEVSTQLLFKLFMPFLAILVVLAVSPYCCTPSKNIPQFFIYGFALFGFVACIALMDAAVILGENDTLSPYFAIVTPFLLLFGIFGWRFAKAR